MKIFLVKLFILSSIISSIFLSIAYLGRPTPDPEVHHMGSMIDKHKRLNEVSGNRLLLVGGSGLAFGIDSEKIEQSTGYSVVNLGVHAGLGADFMLSEVTQNVKTNDVILVIFEYQLYNDIYKANATLISTAHQLFPESMKYYRLNPFETIFVLHSQFKRFFNPKLDDYVTNSIYSRRSFNKYGDITGHLGLDPPTHKPFNDLLAVPDELAAQKKFKLLYETCRKVNAKVFIVMPNYPKSQYQRNKAEVDRIVEKIHEDLDFIPVLGDQTTFLVDDSDLFDTVYHLNAIARSQRTERLIQLLRENNLAR